MEKDGNAHEMCIELKDNIPTTENISWMVQFEWTRMHRQLEYTFGDKVNCRDTIINKAELVLGESFCYIRQRHFRSI